MKVNLNDPELKSYIYENLAENVAKYRKLFSPLVYQKYQYSTDSMIYALRNFGIKELIANKQSEYNTVNEVCTRIYNLTDGLAKFPEKLEVKKARRNLRYDGEYSDGKITVYSSSDFISNLIHELGHFNHEYFCPDYTKMGKEAEIKEDMMYPDYSIFKKFMGNSFNIKLIKSYLGGYATSSPAEFVADMFKAVVNGKKLPSELFDIYKEFDGPFADILYRKYEMMNKLL